MLPSQAFGAPGAKAVVWLLMEGLGIPAETTKGAGYAAGKRDVWGKDRIEMVSEQESRKRRETSPRRRSRPLRGPGERGQALVEFSFVALIFFILVFGIIDFGMGIHSWLKVTSAAREGARVAAVHATQPEIITRVQDAADNLDLNDLTVTVTNAEGNPGETVAVKVDYHYDLITPLAGILQIPSLDITSTVKMRLE